MTRAEDIRLVLAEVAPGLAELVREPPADVGVIALYAFITREQYEIVYRAHCVVIAHRENREPRWCVDCAWDRWITRSLNQSCPHMVSA